MSKKCGWNSDMEAAPRDEWFLGWSKQEGTSRCRWHDFSYQTDLFIAQAKYRGFAEGYPPTKWKLLPAPPAPERET